MPQAAPVRSTLERRLAEAADLVTVALDQLLPRGERPRSAPDGSDALCGARPRQAAAALFRA